ncbi:MAG: hypothetical protein KDD69_16720 [Bdellovibrionales bacterium]|nr:hypothetical protein [Bdellovibrionales bacterium]
MFLPDSARAESDQPLLLVLNNRVQESTASADEINPLEGARGNFWGAEEQARMIENRRREVEQRRRWEWQQERLRDRQMEKERSRERAQRQSR